MQTHLEKTAPTNTAWGPRLAVGAVLFIKKQMARKKPMFHLQQKP